MIVLGPSLHEAMYYNLITFLLPQKLNQHKLKRGILLGILLML